jgi:hypothetical protein
MAIDREGGVKHRLKSVDVSFTFTGDHARLRGVSNARGSAPLAGSCNAR